MKEIFKIGDKVMIITEALNGKEGTITKILDKNMNENSNGTKFVVENDDTVNGYVMERNEIILISREGDKASHFNESMKKVSSRQPLFKTGDIVIIKDFPGKIQYVVKECTFTEQTTRGRTCPLYSYELNTLDESMADGGMIPSTCMCDEYSLILEYHDAQWEKYFTESVRNGLPPWRGELYNFMRLLTSDWGLYKNDTLPPRRMKHILEEHSFYRRLSGLMEVPKIKDEILKRMNRTKDEVEGIINRIQIKIEYRNGMCPKEKLPKYKNGHDSASFDFEENKLIAVVDYCDKYVNKESKDHFPPYMSDYDIMKAIQDAYKSAEKVEIIGRGNQGLQEAKTIYQGKSNEGLDIQFYNNFNLDIIESAYLVFVVTTNRPNIRHLNKNIH